MIAGLPEPLFLMGRGGGGSAGLSGPSFFAPLSSSLAPITGSASPTFTRATTKDYLNSAGLAAQAGVGTAAFNFNQAGGTPGFSCEPTATNLLLWSGDATNAAWTKGNCSITPAAATGPDGVINSAQKIVENSTAAVEHRVFQSFTSTAQGYVLSCFLKAGERTWARLRFSDTTTANAWFNLATGAKGSKDAGVSAYDIQALGNGWYRCWVARTAGAASANVLIAPATGDGATAYDGDGVSGIYTWPGGQLETGIVPSSYIATTTGAVSRAADSLSYPSAGVVTGSQLSVSMWTRTMYDGADGSVSRVLWNLTGSASASMRVYRPGAALRAQLIDTAGHAANPQIATNGANWPPGVWNHAVGTFDLAAGTVQAYFNGVASGPASVAGWAGFGALAASFVIGGSGSFPDSANYRNLGIYSRILSAGDVAALYAAGVH